MLNTRMNGKCSKILNAFLLLFSNEALVFRVNLQNSQQFPFVIKIFVLSFLTASSEQSDQGHPCLSRHF